ncbi:Uncharacterized protein TCM_011947 [Theobroma cacao]|uniref:Uncharacterized protein n=1 Tax=Theobroma cacao TaxID=3641 RepID=A0A061FT73_THECC|nr:Uncharacterized protein TCM_011947 [Theobroma cacao]
MSVVESLVELKKHNNKSSNRTKAREKGKSIRDRDRYSKGKSSDYKKPIVAKAAFGDQKEPPKPCFLYGRPHWVHECP